MTTDQPPQSVLVIGRSQLVLDDAVAGLRQLGYIAQATNDFSGDLTDRFDFAKVDLVMFGTQIPHDREREFTEQIAAINPHVIVVQGLGGIPGLIVNQVQEALSPEHPDPARAPTYTPDDRSIRLALADPAGVKVTVFWRTSIVPPDPKSDSLVLLDERLTSGDHAISIPDHVFVEPIAPEEALVRPAQAVFATVQVDAAIYNFSIAAGQ
jgi:hypothetical protein